MLLTGVLLIPFLGTSLGSAMVFCMKKELNEKIEKLLLGLASGVMLAASIWSLLIPAIDMAQEKQVVSWIPAAVGFLLGNAFLLLLDGLIPHFHKSYHKTNEIKPGFFRNTMLLLAVTLHNFPEGMAVGIAAAGALMGDSGITMAGAGILAVGIAIQNFPEGAIISLPLCSAGISKTKAFWAGVFSGVVEPAGAALTILLAEQMINLLPYFLSFAAGAMIFVVIEDLIPEAQGEKDRFHLGTAGTVLGFVLMMALDIALG